MKTAVEWLAEQYNLVDTAEYEQAKEMEQEQDKNKYSEEEVLDLLNKFDYYPTMYKGNSEADIKEWFENFKKK